MGISSWGFKSPLAHLVVDVFRPSQRRRRWIWPVIILAILGVSFVLTAGGQSSAVAVEDLREDLADLGSKARTFQDVMARLASTDRVEFVDAATGFIDGVVVTRSHIDAYPDDTDPEFLGSLAALRVTLDLWERGVKGFRDGMLSAADDPGAIGVEELLLDSMLDMRAADRLYTDFVSDAVEQGRFLPVSGYPEARALPLGFPIVSAATAYAEVARTAGGPLATASRLVLEAVTTDPEWVQDTSGQVVVASVEALVVKVVVVNAGNVPSETTELGLELTSVEGAVESRMAMVEPLQPGGQRTVSFEDLVVRPGSVYQLAISLDSEGSVEDLSRTLTFRVNQATSDG